MNVDRRAIIGHVTFDFRVGPRGGIGRRDGFKIRCLHGRVSSSLTEGTIPAKIIREAVVMAVVTTVFTAVVIDWQTGICGNRASRNSFVCNTIFLGLGAAKLWLGFHVDDFREIDMLRLFTLVAALFLAPQIAAAQAVWANYSFNVKPGAEAKIEKAVRAYFDGNEAFKGKVFFNRQVINGANPATHNIAIVQPSMSDWETGVARTRKDAKFAALAQIVAQNAVSIDESLLTHVKGYGEIKGEGAKFMTFALSVSNPAKLVKAFDKAFSKPGSWTLTGPLDLFAVMAGGAPSITHIAVVAMEDFASFQSYLSSEHYQDMRKDLDRVRQIRAIGMVENIVFQGPFDLNTLR